MAKHPDFVLRPFEGLADEADWVALREILPVATGTARTLEDYGGVDVTVTSILPEGWAGLRRSDGTVLVALQTLTGSGDASRDIADTILRTIDLVPGTALVSSTLPEPGPRLQDILDPEVSFNLQLQDSFDFWLDPAKKNDPGIAEAIKEANESIFPTERVPGVSSAFWCRMGKRTYVRWVRTEDEEAVLDALARVHAARKTDLNGNGKVLGAFRAAGLSIPVWEVDSNLDVEELAEPFTALSANLEAAFAQDTPLDSAQRRARAGLVSRQVTLR